MFLSFKHKRPQNKQIENNSHDTIANNIAQKCIKFQEQSATYMQRKSERLSDQAKKFVLVLFFLLSCGYCLYLISEGFFNSKSKTFSIAPIKIPEHLSKAGDKNKGTVIVSKAEYERIHRFKLYMDSLARNASDKRLYESILSRRPGLMDSIRVIENLYQLQSSKK